MYWAAFFLTSLPLSLHAIQGSSKGVTKSFNGGFLVALISLQHNILALGERERKKLMPGDLSLFLFTIWLTGAKEEARARDHKQKVISSQIWHQELHLP